MATAARCEMCFERKHKSIVKTWVLSSETAGTAEVKVCRKCTPEFLAAVEDSGQTATEKE